MTVLAKAGAGTDVADTDGDSPLHRAALHGFVDVIASIARFAELQDAENKAGITPMMSAAINGHFDVVEILVSAGHEIDHKNNSGNTALMISTQRGDADSVDRLLALGANPREVNQNRLNVADIAERFGHSSVTEVLERY